MSWKRLASENHRGVLVPRTLGIGLAVAATGSTILYASLREVGRAGWGALAGVLLVFSAGLVDDVAPVGPRGLRNHLRWLAAGRMTTGILKVIVTAGAAVVVVALQPERPGGIRLAGIVLLAASANVWNGLDVRPGRALKAYLLPAVAFLVWGDPTEAPAVLGVLIGAVLALPLDLRELAMLGDGGSNALGFGAGLAMYQALSDPWVPIAAATAIVLNVVADTLTFTRVIDASPQLRWLDGLGRRA